MYSDRRSFLLLALIVALPFFLFFSFQAAFEARNHQRAVLREAQADADLIIARADGIVLKARAAADALATAPMLAGHDRAGMAARVAEVWGQNPDWSGVAISDNRSGEMFLGDAVPTPTQRPPAMAPGATSVSLVREADCACVWISRGFARPGKSAATLHVKLANAVFVRLLPRAHGDYEVSALADSAGRFVARSLSDKERFANLGSASLQKASRSTASEGVYPGKSLEGVSFYTAFARSDVTGWTAHVALKAQRIDTPQALFWTMIGLAALISLGLAGLLYYVARQQVESTRAITRRVQEAQKMEALGQLTGGMAHDFNNLLTPIVGALDRLVRSERLDDREKRFARGALESAERAATLTKQLLGFSRRQKLEIQPVDVCQALDEVCGLADQSLGPRYELRCEVDPAAGFVATDKVQLELAALNLVLNARDAMPGGGTITLRASPATGGEVAVSIVDEGTGMDEATLRSARDPFFTTKAQGMGTGLGLAQVTAVVHQSGGRLEIRSEQGEGTTVTMHLPKVAAPEGAMASRSPAARVKPMRLLIVDDEAAVRETIVQMVEGDGHVVESVANGETALAALGHGRPDLLLVDFAMPGLNGAQVVAQARQIHPALACLLITGHWDSDAMAEAGVDCHILRKPFTLDALRAAMAEAIGAAKA